MANILIAGCGDIGSALAERLRIDGHRVWGLRRHTAGLPISIQPFVADLAVPETLQALPPGLDFVFYTAASDAASDEGYRRAYVDGVHNILTALASQRQAIRRIFFTSSTGVYAQSAGEWVDELSPTQPQHFSGVRMLEGERLLLDSPFPATIVRLGGIYGPGRTRLIRQVRQGEAVYRDGPALYTNRIHRADCAGVLCHLMTLAQPETLYLGVDHEPAEQKTVYGWLAQQLKVAPPRIASLSEGGNRGGNKRCRNTKLVDTGYVFQYPSFREGYAAELAELAAEAHGAGMATLDCRAS
jgi:nucleoside-diphosphate-sugar epimerase